MAIRNYDPQRRFECFDLLRQPKNMSRFEVLSRVIWRVIPQMVNMQRRYGVTRVELGIL
ncbi:MAG: hypothetical protein NZO16_03875 [Deltaproteobacteria bacterium]|nr:hypothetical protein [Deltaproteobacteria bacterium]